LEDQFVYLPAIKKHLTPALYPYDSAIFEAQTRLSSFDELVAWSVKATGLPLDAVVFLWHLLSIFLILAGSLRLSRRCFAVPQTQWAAVLILWAALVMPVAGTQLTLTDLYLHPRDLATGLLLFAFIAVLDRKITALAWIALAAVIHPTMAAYGAFHLAIQRWRMPRHPTAIPLALPLVIPFGRVHNEAWHEVLTTRRFLFPWRWYWYEWLGVVAPFALFAWFGRIARKRDMDLVAHISERAILSGCLGVLGSFVITGTPVLERFIPSEPMRTLHFVYLLWVLLGGGLLAELVLRNRPLRVFAWVMTLATVFYVVDRLVYSASPHVEWPGRVARNSWCEAYAWVRANTPPDALFTLNPRYFDSSGVDGHSFRALADRSQLLDWSKDRGVAATWPELSARWLEQTRDLEQWSEFNSDDFRHLQQKYGVTWVLVDRKEELATRLRRVSEVRGVGLPCPFENDAVLVCRIE
jgi:hypothetical protein